VIRGRYVGIEIKTKAKTVRVSTWEIFIYTLEEWIALTGSLLEERQLNSDDPSDAGPGAIYALPRPS
jgi:hypothetical protein